MKYEDSLNCSDSLALAYLLLVLLLIVSKASGYIDLGWVWVLSPLWLPFVPLLVVTAILLIACVFSACLFIFIACYEKFNKGK